MTIDKSAMNLRSQTSRAMLSLKALVLVLELLCMVSQMLAVANGGDDLRVYPDVPGIGQSEHFSARVRGAHCENWSRVFMWQTECKTDQDMVDRYPKHLAGWTHSYINFEIAGSVEIELSRADQSPIRSAVPHPRNLVKSCVVKNGKAFIVLEKSCQIAVDIDGQMDNQNTGMGYKGPPIHSVSIFANPLIRDKPRLDDPTVYAVKPGEVPPADGPWKTLYFLPGVHDIGAAFPVHANHSYYIPGDTLVYGTFSNHKKWSDGHDIRIFGHGTLSGARLKHPDFAEQAVRLNPALHNPIDIVGAANTTVEGITLTDAAHHSVMLISGYDPAKPTDLRWLKILNWRINGDGINPFGNGMVEDCFIRTQDDSLYVSGRGIRRTVIWNDYNGSSFVLSSLPQLTDRNLVIEDCTVIYSRAGWYRWSGGRVFNMRGEGEGDCGTGVIFRNITVEDSRPTLQQFFINMTIPKAYSPVSHSRSRGALAHLAFENVSIAAESVIGEPQTLWGTEGARIHDLRFSNLQLGGKVIKDASFFKTNEFVDSLFFETGEQSRQ